MGYRDPRGNGIATGLLVVGVVGATFVAGPGDAGLRSASLAAVLVVGGRGRTIGGLVASIALGAVVLGGVGWVAATVVGTLPMNPTVAAGLGLAVGGGLGSVVWLLVFGEESADSTETMTVDMADAESEPAPAPTDLFEASPDPIVFFAEGVQGPVVMAANQAFESVFGVSGSAMAETPLAEGLLVAEDAGDVVDAARNGETFDRVLTCETADGQQPMRVRLAVTDDPDESGGYVLYTPVETA